MLWIEIATALGSLCLSGCGGSGSLAAVPLAPAAQTAQYAALSIAKSPSEALLPYNPPAGTYPLFPKSIFLERIPANPPVNPNSAAWLARLGTLGLGELQFAADANGLKNDYTYPIYPMASPAQGGTPVKVHCTEPWGTCNVEGTTVYVLPGELPEDYGTSGDAHMTLIDAKADKEFDFFGTQWPPSNGVLTIAWGGSCSLSGDGYSHCSATATSTPLSIGIIRAKDLLLAARGHSGTLPYALQVATKCSNGSIAPMISGDGHQAGCAPEGSRVYLAMHDRDVDAGSQSPIEKAILRTIDEDHYGMIITDTNGGQDGFSLQTESDLSYTVFGREGPLVHRLIPEAAAEGLPGSTGTYDDTYYLRLPFNGVDFAGKLKFL